MSSAKQRKPVKTKKTNIRVKDLRPAKDAKGGAQKKEGPDLNQITAPAVAPSQHF